jgi:tRNA G10  N-methylase Trm11
MRFEATDGERLTHYLFRYPAKFHPPVVRHLIKEYTAKGDVILDPFCGSGTLLIEAAVSGRSAIGSDVDPLAVFVARAKTLRVKTHQLKQAADLVLTHLRGLARAEREYARRQFEDIAPQTAARIVRDEGLLVPSIPNLFHWFRAYVVVDLGRILTHLRRAALRDKHRELLLLCFASIIRAASNADPVPVSGLEVTSHMLKRDEAGRIVNPFDLFEKAVKRALIGVESYMAKTDSSVHLSVLQEDATALSSRITGEVNAVITSPPYNGAVDYYRRHQLEMFWLGFTNIQEERLALLPKYIGRSQVPKSHPLLCEEEIKTPLVRSWAEHIRSVSPQRADAFRHYVLAMKKALQEISSVLESGGRAIFVVGHSSWNGQQIPTGRLFAELAEPTLSLAEHLWYPVVNRYMSYARHNGANIDREYVLVFKKGA